MKQPVILVNKHGRPSVRAIYKAIGGDMKLLTKSSLFNGMIERHKGVKRKLRGLEEPDLSNCVVARWGSRQPIVTNEHTVVYNKIEAVEKTNSKGECRRILREAGVAIPVTYLRNEDMSNIKFPCIGRPEFHGQGKNFYVCNNHQDIERAKQKGATYFSEFYDKQREIRCHCFMGNILAVMEKPRPRNNQDMRWNRSINDDPFTVLDRKDWPQHACLLALKACETMKLDYAGIDVMLSDLDGSKPSVICELNSSPTLVNSPYVLEKYIKAFKWLFASDKRRPKWAFESFKKVESLAWKNFQLEPDFEIPLEHRLK